MNDQHKNWRDAFTLIEILVSISVLALLLVVVYGILQQTSKVWVAAEARSETFQSARLALEMITRDLEGAIVGTNNLPPPNGKRITFLTREDANGSPHASGDSDIADTPPNDQIFFIANLSDSVGQSYIDLAEYGYFVAFTSTNKHTMAGPAYYLLRHQVRSSSSVSAYNFLADPATWYTTPTIGPDHKLPIADHVLRLELRYEKIGGTAPQGTCVLDNWLTASGSCSAGSIDSLPRAVHFTMCVLDRRAAARFYSIVGTSGLSSTELAKIPDAIDTITNAALANILREHLRTFYRTVYLKNPS
jgi:prepilin-type N-terminal cleavage/methylation domain-containing protein